jgi:hypothetical protein
MIIAFSSADEKLSWCSCAQRSPSGTRERSRGSSGSAAPRPAAQRTRRQVEDGFHDGRLGAAHQRPDLARHGAAGGCNAKPRRHGCVGRHPAARTRGSAACVRQPQCGTRAHPRRVLHAGQPARGSGCDGSAAGVRVAALRRQLPAHKAAQSAADEAGCRHSVAVAAVPAAGACAWRRQRCAQSALAGSAAAPALVAAHCARSRHAPACCNCTRSRQRRCTRARWSWLLR